MDELPGNPYHFKGSDEYWKHFEKQQKSFSDGLKKGKDIYTRKREPVGECPICYDKIDNGFVTTNCGHTLCLDCFEKTIKSNTSNCPMCRSIMITGMISESMVSSMIKEAFDNGWGDGYEEGCNNCEEVMNSQIDIGKRKLDIIEEKYKSLKKIYNGTVIQLQNTHTLNFNQQKKNTIFRTFSE